MLKAGVIGLGVGRQHALALREHGQCDVVMLCDLDSQRLQVVGDEFPGAERTAQWENLTANSNIDLVCIASYDDTHRDQVLAALAAGKHVFVEKPMCLTAQEARDIRQALDATPKARLSSNLPLRTCPRFQEVRRVVQAGEMGEVYHLEGHYLWGRPHKLTSGWRSEMEFYSIIHGGAVHMVDTLLWITEKRPVSVVAMGSDFSSRGTPMRYNDFATLTMRFADGCTATVTVHGGCRHPHHHRLAVYGTKKTFFQDSDTAQWLTSNDPEATPIRDQNDYPAKDHRGEVLTSFVEYVLGNVDRPLVSESDAFSTMAVCLAAEESVNTKSEITIDYKSFEATS